MAIWIGENWKWIVKAWKRNNGILPRGKKTVSQSSISRLMTYLDESALAALMTKYNRISFMDDWTAFVSKEKERAKKRRLKSAKRKTRKRRHAYIPAKKQVPQYSLDGKSRAGCKSQATGRTEVDLTLFQPETFNILAMRTLMDKEGEQTAAVEMINLEGKKLPRGIFTGDAGITCPNVISAVVNAGHGYIFGIKGNAGKVFEEIQDYEWDDLADTDLFFNEGHGREEIRSIKSAKVSSFQHPDLFSKYENAKIVFQVTADTHHIKDDRYTTETRYFVGDSAAEALNAHEALTYIRDHWRQESYHWIKDVILGEDDSFQKRNNGSRILGVLRAVVAKIGELLFGSTKKFTDTFVAAPEKTSKL